MSVSSTFRTDLAGNYQSSPRVTASKPAFTTDQKKWLGISTASILLGGGAVALLGSRAVRSPQADGEMETAFGEVDIDVSDAPTDDMPFQQAFQACLLYTSPSPRD